MRSPAASKAFSSTSRSNSPRSRAKTTESFSRGKPSGPWKTPRSVPFLDEAELAGDRQRGRVPGVDANLDPVDLADLEAGPRQRGGRLSAEALAGSARADPVADLEDALAAARVEAGAADHLGLVRREDPVDEVLAEVEAPAEAAQQLDLRLQRLRILVRPRHPLPQVLER